MSPVDLALPPTIKRVYPHVEDIVDWRAQQTIRLLWERVFTLEARLQAVETTAGDLVNQSNSLEDQLTAVDRKADHALAEAQLRRAGEGGGTTGPQLPSMAPDMFHVVEETYASPVPGGGTWNLSAQLGPTGQSKFVEAVVNALHALDANWGHLAKTGGQNGSVAMGGDGHAVDAINWKNPDGVTAEIFDIVRSDGAIQWIYDPGSRSNSDAFDNWYYP